MTAIEFYKFIQEKGIEYNWYKKRPGGHDPDVAFFIDNADVEEFHALIQSSIFDDDGIECIMKNGYLVFWASDICNYFEIDIENIFKKNE